MQREKGPKRMETSVYENQYFANTRIVNIIMYNIGCSLHFLHNTGIESSTIASNTYGMDHNVGYPIQVKGVCYVNEL